ncbi:cytochrome P450 [Mycolicibacterium moriokaense]|nr:cytochrome P450 [Mycolicibacterium moriokaense]
MHHCADRTAPFTVNFPGMGAVHFVATADGAREILTLPRDVVCAPTPNPIEPIVGASSVILTSGEQHRRQRRQLSPAFRGDQTRALAGAMARAVGEDSTRWRRGDRVALHRTSQAITKRIIIQTVLGVGPGPGSDAFERVVSALLDTNTAALMLLPGLRRDFAGRGPWARLLASRRQFNDMLADQISSARRSATCDGTVLSRLLAQAHRDDTDETELVEQLRTLLVAGHDTTASALAWALYHVHRDDGIRDRVLDELASGPPPEQMPRLPYLSAVISETLRMHPAVPIVLRKLTEPRTVVGRDRKAGDIVGIAVPALHFNRSIWPDPYLFDPDRFLRRTPSPFEYVPFGGGYRRCPGALFAHDELAIAIGTVMRHATLRVPDDEQRRKPPRAVPRGIATVPHREITLEVLSTNAAEPGVRDVVAN